MMMDEETVNTAMRGGRVGREGGREASCSGNSIVTLECPFVFPHLQKKKSNFNCKTKSKYFGFSLNQPGCSFFQGLSLHSAECTKYRGA